MLTRATVRAFSTEALKVVHNVAKQQFEVSLKGDEAVLDYETSGKTITLNHTTVPEVFKGKGIGKILAKNALDYAMDNKLDVVCKCDFLAHYYNKNKAQYKTLKIEFQL